MSQSNQQSRPGNGQLTTTDNSGNSRQVQGRQSQGYPDQFDNMADFHHNQHMMHHQNALADFHNHHARMMHDMQRMHNDMMSTMMSGFGAGFGNGFGMGGGMGTGMGMGPGFGNGFFGATRTAPDIFDPFYDEYSQQQYQQQQQQQQGRQDRQARRMQAGLLGLDPSSNSNVTMTYSSVSYSNNNGVVRQSQTQGVRVGDLEEVRRVDQDGETGMCPFS